MSFSPLLVAVKSTQNRQANMQCNFSKDTMVLERWEKYSFVVLVWYSPQLFHKTNQLAMMLSSLLSYWASIDYGLMLMWLCQYATVDTVHRRSPKRISKACKRTLQYEQQNTGLLHSKKIYFSYVPQSNKLYEKWILAGLFHECHCYSLISNQFIKLKACIHL